MYFAGAATRAMTRAASVALTTGRGSEASYPSQQAIDAAIAAHVGIPYEHNGRGPDSLDCLGLIVSFYRAFGVQVPDGDGQPISEEWWQVDPERYLRGLLSVGRPVSEPLQALDLVYFRIGGVIRHAGVMVDSQRFIHVLERRSVMVTRLGGWWRSKLAGARRLV